MKLSEFSKITEKRAKEFEKIGITDTAELVRYFPRAYLDMTDRVSLREVFHNETALVACTLAEVEPVRKGARTRYVKAHFTQDGDYFTAIWFNMPYVFHSLKSGDYLLYGRVQNRYGSPTIVNPTFERLDRNVRLKGLVPVYPLRGALTQRTLRDSVRYALSVEPIVSAIPPQLQQKYRLTDLKKAFFAIHKPNTQEEMRAAADRIALEEYFLMLTAFKLIKGDRNEARVNKYSVTEREVAAFLKTFPFTLTEGQASAVRDIYNNVKSPTVMNRLLQGDVGSGKTAVALAGIFMAVKSGFQAVYLSPTEVLAAQNYELLKRTFPTYPVGYLAGSASAKEKRAVKEALANGDVQILCGTHAVLQSDVQFKNLAFCVCDEQHRFGVAQRNILSEKGDNPDVLVMSATPIPRTLSLIFYGDLDITTIHEKPKERQEISTALVSERKYDDMLCYIRDEVHKGRQAYFVCAKIEDDEGEVTSVTELYEELKGRLPSVRFALLHGRMKEKEKNETMAAFKRKEYNCLVATTVIEVGIDVPDATIMVIMNAERFGLSQLHQLRGRVGRGSEKSWCFLMMGGGGEEARERLNVLKSTTDGFALAEKDLELRGSGDFLGTRQSGKFLSEIKNLRYGSEVIFQAKKLADEALEGRMNYEQIKKAALQKYESLKDVVLN